MAPGRLPAEPCSMPDTDASPDMGVDVSAKPGRLPAEPCDRDLEDPEAD